MESLVSDIPAGDGKTANPFLQCVSCTLAFGDVLDTSKPHAIRLALLFKFDVRSHVGIHFSFSIVNSSNSNLIIYFGLQFTISQTYISYSG